MKRLACALVVVVAAAVVAGADEKKSAELTLTPPKDVTLKPGESKEIQVKIDRKGLDEDVAIKFNNVPKDVKIDKPDQKVKKGEKGANYVLIAGATAEVGKHKIEVVASCKDLKVAKEFAVTIKK
jgi:hypothetical protein